MRMTSARHSKLRLYAIVVLAGFEVSAVANVFVQVLSHFRFPTDCTSTLCFWTLGTSIGGFVLMMLGAWGIYSGLVRAGYIQPTRSPPILQAGSGPEDDRILMIANELLSKFKLRGTRFFETLAWTENSQWFWINMNQGFRKPRQLVLWIRFRGMLSPDEWRTLLSYYFIWGKLHLRSLVGFLWWLLPSFLYVLAGLGVYSVFGYPAGPLFDVSGGPIIGLCLLLRFFPMTKETFLRQDKWAARSMGQSSLLALFKKIDSLEIPEILNSKRRTGWIATLWPMPNITERISNLQS